ncbi:hypothetical protein AC578_4585 [Pseudocercospora eumusae]|uniref:Heterokaryon incompatibility domain-containing protein n=1 Tax=Pseudocercospora eumusae TaxID=321146 RepID=A0A139H4F1_9PEZI|nr:hypothetical protein AC578_4585 [Pseudocercospora eumusae]
MTSRDQVRQLLYRPLSSERKEIRVLVVDGGQESTRPISLAGQTPSNGHAQDLLAFRLEYLRLTDHVVPFYDAVSYSWGGDKEDRTQIVLDGLPFWIPTKAEQALRAVSVEHGHPRVWLDAVCIDQEEPREKSLQVALMGEVYSKARRVLIWLGEDRGDTDTAVRSIRKLLEGIEQKLPAQYQTPDSGSAKDLILNPNAHHITSKQISWTSIYSVFSRKWFTRAWIIQEVALAKQPVVYIGKHSLDWTELSSVAVWLYERRQRLPRSPSKGCLTGLENVALIGMFKLRKSQKLGTLLRLVYSFETHDPRDMVYAVLGLRSRTAQKPGSTSRIVPIYEEPVVETYAKATKAAIIELGSLGLLKHAHSLRPVPQSKAENGEFPSWALRMDLRGGYHINPISYRNFRFNAHDGMPLKIWPNDSSRVLKVEGILIDRITDISPVMSWKLYGERFSDTITAAAVLHSTYSWTCDQLPAWPTNVLSRKFTITVAAGQDSTGRNLLESTEHAQRLHEGFLHAATAPEPEPASDVSDTESLKSSKSTTSISSRSTTHSLHSMRSMDSSENVLLESENPDATYAMDAMMKGGHHRTVCITEKGYVCLCTDNVKKDDALVVLFGGSVPFVLRPNNHFYYFVGDAFVEDLMDGYHVRTLRSQGRLNSQTAWFKIR